VGRGTGGGEGGGRMCVFRKWFMTSKGFFEKEGREICKLLLKSFESRGLWLLMNKGI
jgi:hypothetical protein